MALITWNEEQHATTVGKYDDEHKVLFGLLNDLDDAVPGGNHDQVGGKLNALVGYVVEHFAREEAEMQAKGYKGFAAHKAEHDKLVATCSELQTKFRKGEAAITPETTLFVKDWLDGHIPKIDRAYGPTMNA